MPIALREYWDSVDCLYRGVLWPRYIGDAAERAELRDQGLREIQALATASQAFQVCSGAIDYRETVKDAKATEQTREAKLGIDFAGIANRLIGLTIGGLLGYGVRGDAAGAAGGAGLVAAASGLWSSRRSAKLEQSLDYTFIRDRSLQTLERDLPLVIERARAAGLAPVFLIDELDKVADPEQSITDLINRLKHLTTDYGFFCFLTSPDYFEFVERRIAERIYPPEHSNFSDRLFVVYTPKQLADFLGRVIVVENPRPEEQSYDEQARVMLVRMVMHRSRLNIVDVMRELARWWTAQGELIESSQAIATNFANSLVVVAQLAVESVLEFPIAQAILRRSPLWQQFAIDAAYRISSLWEARTASFDESQGAWPSGPPRGWRGVVW